MPAAGPEEKLLRTFNIGLELVNYTRIKKPSKK